VLMCREIARKVVHCVSVVANESMQCMQFTRCFYLMT